MPVTDEAIRKGIDMMLSADLKNPPEFNAMKLATWAELLGDWTDEMFLSAVIKACRSLVFFPNVGELRKTFGQTKEQAEVEAIEAWELVRAAIRRHGKGASFCASDLNGNQAALWALARMGAEAVGMMTDEDRAIKAAEFRRLYQVARERGYGLEYLAGKFETDNTARGLDTTGYPALVGRKDMPQVAPALAQPQEKGLVAIQDLGGSNAG